MARIWNKHKQSNTPFKRKVFVALSGGVDSSVAAALLLRAGYDVSAVYMEEWIPPGIECSAGDDRQTAARASAHLGIPFAVWDFSRAYEKHVAAYMLREYKEGRTPNPDVMCNKEIKFGIFFRHALEAGADFIATGHYVRLEARGDGLGYSHHSTLNPKPYTLYAGKDSNKDQSYFLWTLIQEQLRYCLFPIGGYTKPEVRALAKKFKLPNWDRKDSQGVCFTGPFDFGEFLRIQIPQQEGVVVTLDGREIGRHEGAVYATIGQKIGIKNYESRMKGKTPPMYVAGKNINTNTLVITEEQDAALYKRDTTVSDVNWISGTQPHLPMQCLVRIRYRQLLQKATISMIRNSRFIIQFEEFQRAVAPGQSAVFYAADGKMLGGGVIDDVKQ